ncbi:GntP family permease [Leptolyngbya sp. 15MV]|nr:GntP family permease [Leptolyngbya sp. 15MV]
MTLVLILVALVAFIVLATARWKLHPFLALLAAALIGGAAYGLPLADLPKVVGEGFGAILGSIGIVIVLGTVIGVILERTGAAITMAESVIRLLGNRFPTLCMSLIGFIVSIPVFCDSAYVILNSLKNAVAERMKVSVVAMSVALATGLYATHTFVPPTPGPIAAAGNLGLTNLGLLIAVGLVVALATALAGMAWGNRYIGREVALIDAPPVQAPPPTRDRARPGPLAAFAPIFLPIALICLGSVASFPTRPMGEGALAAGAAFVGHPMVALLIGLVAAAALIPTGGRTAQFADHVRDGIVAAAPILVITGAGGAFGAVLKATPLGTVISEALVAYNLGLLAPFLIAAGLKSAQGSTTVALVTTSAMFAPMLGDLGYATDMGRVLVVLAIGAGAMTVSHVNDSFFWAVSQFSRLPLPLAYRAFTAATLVQGLTGITTVYLLGFIFL